MVSCFVLGLLWVVVYYVSQTDYPIGAIGPARPSFPHRLGRKLRQAFAQAVRWCLDHGFERIAYVDVDVHHGDGPQAIFYGDPRVLTISIHQTGATLFPGTGFVDELGAGEAVGTKVNVPLPPFTDVAGWLSAFHAVVPPLVRAWRPDVLVTQLGCDTHHSDPLAMLGLTTSAYRRTAATLHRLAHEEAGGRWLATGGGGYQWASDLLERPDRPSAVFCANDVVAFIEAELPRLIDGFLRDRATNKTPMPVGAGGKEPT
jgi:hypothetical protein